MIPFLTDVAKQAGCQDVEALSKALEEASRTQSSAIEAVLNSGLVDEEAFVKALAGVMGLPLWTGQADKEDRRLAKVLPAEIALTNMMLPVRLEKQPDTDAVVHIAVQDPFDLLARRELMKHVSGRVTFQLASRTQIAEGLQAIYGVGADTFEKILQGRSDFDADHLKEETNVLDEDDDEVASVVKFVNEILRGGLNRRATDIHLEPLEDSLRIRYRVDGVLEEVPVPDRIKALQASVISRIKIMARLDVAERRVPQDGRIHLELEGTPIDVRVATIPSVEGESVSLRLLVQKKFQLDTMGMLPDVRQTIDKLLALPNGIVLVTGPTGSGKSTTLYTFLSSLNTSERRIVSIEDPVENKLPGVVQIAVKPEIGLDFAAGLRSILRGDPNIVMVGEMRDLETTEIAIRAALTGHLVFSTLHTNDAVGGITRLLDMGVEPFLVASSVRAFIAQRLVRRLCEKCRKPIELDAQERSQLGLPGEGTVYGAVGCPSCRGTGYFGRMAIYEICLLSQEMQNLITHGAQPTTLYKQALKDGFIPMRRYGWAKVLAGETTIEEVLSATASESEAPSKGLQVQPLGAEMPA